MAAARLRLLIFTAPRMRVMARTRLDHDHGHHLPAGADQGEGVLAGQGAEEDGHAAQGQEIDDQDGVQAAGEDVRPAAERNEGDHGQDRGEGQQRGRA